MQNFITAAIKKGLGFKDKVDMTGVSPGGLAVKPEKGNHPLSHMYNNRWNRATLEYPYDIQQRSDLGHYMMFYINVPNQTKWQGGNAKRSGDYTDEEFNYGLGTNNVKKLGNRESTIARQGRAYSSVSQANSDLLTVGSTSMGYNNDFSKSGARNAFQGTANKQAKREPRTTRTSDSIVLYMPPGISSTYGAGWKDVEYGMVGGSTAAMGVISGAEELLQGGKSKAIEARLQAAIEGPVQTPNGKTAGGPASDVFGEFTTRKLGGTLGQMAGAGEAFTALDKMANRALNNYIEAVFTGIGYRKFSYQWKFTPRDPEEAYSVDTIIRTFKFHMLPEYQKDGDGRYFTVPSEFEMYYMYRGDENTWLNKIKTCVLTNMEVNYTPNTNWQTLRPIGGRNGAPPAEIDMKLDFQETDLVTKEDILEGF